MWCREKCSCCGRGLGRKYRREGGVAVVRGRLEADGGRRGEDFTRISRI